MELTDAERREREDWHLTDALEHESGEGNPFAAGFRMSPVAQIYTDPRRPDNPIRVANVAFQRLTGYSLGDVMDRNCRFLQCPDTDPETVDQIRSAIAHRQEVSVVILNRKKSGQPFWNALSIAPVPMLSGEIQFYIATQEDVTDRLDQERTNREKVTALTREIHHRVKNNLQNSNAMIRLAARRAPTPEMRAYVEAIANRHSSQGAIQNLLDVGGGGELDLSALARQLADKQVHASGRDDITVRMDLGLFSVPAADAEAVGIAVNEAITNAFKHAFVDRPGRLDLRIHQDGERLEIEVSDDGPGFDPAVPSQSLGRGLSTSLTRQIGGTTTWHVTPAGTTVRISVPVRDWPRSEARS